MSIARKVTGLIGPKVYQPEGPYGAAGNFPFPSFAPGDISRGELGAEYEFVLFAANVATTLNQGDCLVWDNTGFGVQSLTGTGAHPFGAQVGTVFFGGQSALEQQITPPLGNIWTATLQPGVYGVWCQRAGKGLANIATVNAQSKPLNTTAVGGQLNAPAAALAGSMGFAAGTFSPCPTSNTFTANTTAGSGVLTGVAWTKSPGIERGMTVSGTGVPTGAVVTDFSGSTVTISPAATAAGTGVTITVSRGNTYGNTTNNSALVTGVTSIAGVYPNQTISGTGIAGSTTIVSVTGTAAGGYTITLSQPATVTGPAVNLTTSGYIEAFLNWPTIAVQN